MEDLADSDADPGAALRELLITTAEELLADRQVTAVTTRDIARAAGVSDGVLYNYFASKDDLLVTALVRRFRRGVAEFEARLPEPGTATVEENLNRFTRALFDLNTAALPSAAGLMTDLPLLHRFLEEIHRPPFGAQRHRERLIEYLEAERRLGRLSVADVDAATTLLSGAAALLAVTGVIHGDPALEAGQLPSLVATLLRGLDPAAPPPAG